MSFTTFFKLRLIIKTFPSDVATNRWESCRKLTIDVIFSLLDGARSLDWEKTSQTYTDFPVFYESANILPLFVA